MNTFIKKHQKKFLAIFSIGLMITFVASSGYGRGANHRSETVIGHAGKDAIYNTELEQSRREWALLKEYVTVEQNNPYGGDPQREPLVQAMLGAPIVAAIEDKPEMFMLLRREARAAGVRVDNDQLNTIITNYVHHPASEDDTLDDSIRDAVTSLLLINGNFDRVTTDIKVSKPALDQEVARQLQKVTLDLVEFAAPKFEAAAPPPTPQQVQQQFDRFANVAPGDTTAPNNPFGFGYRMPDRVRLQYLTIQQADVKAAVIASMSPYDWDVKANLYYLQNPQNYATTQAAEAATRPTLGPTTRPFALVHDEVLEAVRQPMIEKLALDVQGRIFSGMQTAWSMSTAITRPSVADLQRIADSVTADLRVPVRVTDLSNDELSATQLAALPGIGSASSGRSTFATDVMGLAAAYLKDPTKVDALHQLTKPAPPVFDNAGNIYQYRLVGADAAAPAPSVASVQGRINNDLRTMAGYDRAKSAAEALLTAANTTGLRPAAVAIGQPVVTTDPFAGIPAGENLRVSLSDAARGDFVRQAFLLLNQYDASKKPNPLGLIEVPQDGRVFVVRLADVTRSADVPEYKMALQIKNELRMQLMRPFFAQWFNYDAIAHRNGYVPVTKSDAV